uniref:Flavin-containing monooxygenase n=1 Tax=Meloidogyne javanica TaxID=6303 RepID=A0A915N9E2_MELJA
MSLIENKKVENVNNYLNEEIKIIILGAGPTALEEEIGGLARSVIDENGFCWDLGVHVMGISKYKNFVEAMEECVTEWEIIPRCAMAEMSHVWTVPISQMGTSWLQGRVPLIDLSQLKRRCSLTHQKLLIEDEKRQTAFRYPANCRGIGEMWKHKNGNKKKFNYNILISTIPLTELEKMIGINNLSKPLKHSTVILKNYRFIREEDLVGGNMNYLIKMFAFKLE